MIQLVNKYLVIHMMHGEIRNWNIGAKKPQMMVKQFMILLQSMMILSIMILVI